VLTMGCQMHLTELMLTSFWVHAGCLSKPGHAGWSCLMTAPPGVVMVLCFVVIKA
jgi:hypothetical protein